MIEGPITRIALERSQRRRDYVAIGLIFLATMMAAIPSILFQLGYF